MVEQKNKQGKGIDLSLAYFFLPCKSWHGLVLQTIDLLPSHGYTMLVSNLSDCYIVERKSINNGSVKPFDIPFVSG